MNAIQFCYSVFIEIFDQVPIELAASNHFNYRHLVKVAIDHDHQMCWQKVGKNCNFWMRMSNDNYQIGFEQDVLAMVVFGLLLSLVFGAVVCGGLGSIARQKNIQVVRIVTTFMVMMRVQVEDLEYFFKG